MKKIIAATIISISLLLFSLFTALIFVDYTSIYQNFLSQNNINVSKEAPGKVTLNKLPFPHLKITDIKKENKFELHDIEIHFSPLSLIRFKPEVNLLKIATAKIRLDSKDFNLVNHDLLIAQLIKEEVINGNVEISNLILLDSGNNPYFKITNFSFNNNPGEAITFRGAAEKIGEFIGSFTTKNEEVNFNLNIKNSGYEFKIAEIYKNDLLIQGAIEGKIIDLSTIINYMTPDLSFLNSNINTREMVNIKIDITPSAEMMQFNNITVNSSFLTGYGNISLSRNEYNTDIINLKFSQLDGRKLFAANNTKIKELRHKSGIAFNDKTIKIDISLDKIFLIGNEILSNVKISSNLNEGRFFINNFSGEIDSGGSFLLNGEVTHNEFRSVFDGKAYLKHQDLNAILIALGQENISVQKTIPLILSAELKMTLIDIYLQNILLKTDEAQITGSIASKLIGSLPRFNALLNFSSVDLGTSNFPIISHGIEYFTSLTKKMREPEYLSKFIPVRKISYLGNGDISFNDVIWEGKSLGKVDLSFNVAPGKIKVSNLLIHQGSNYLSTSFELAATGLKPELSVKINDGSFKVNFLSPSSLLNFRQILLTEYSMDKILLKVDCEYLKLLQNDTPIDNLKFSVENDNILFKVSNLEATVFSGQLKGSGNFLLEPYSINFVYALNSLNLAELATILPRGYFNPQGAVSLNGMFTTNGDSLEKWLYNLYVKASVLGKDVIMNSFSIDDLITKVADKEYNLEELPADIKTATLTGTTSLINLKGNFDLSNGLLAGKDIVFQTKYSSGSASMNLNIYDFGINLSSIFSFYPANQNPVLNLRKIEPNKLSLKVTGSIFEPQKILNSADLLQSLQARKK